MITKDLNERAMAKWSITFGNVDMLLYDHCRLVRVSLSTNYE